MSADKDLISIIIVVKNERGVEATLDHIKANRRNVSAKVEVIVVDSAQPDRLADIRAKHSWVLWDQFSMSNVRTTPQQRNRGLELAKGNVVVFIDANCVPTAEWLPAMHASIKDGQAIVCGPVHDAGTNNLVHYAPTLSEGKYVDVCTTINVGMQRKVIDKIGGFDVTFSFGQDIDFFWRARDAGYKIYYNPNVTITHDWGTPEEQVRRAYNYGKARAHLFKKHWKARHRQLIHEPHVWMYPLFILGLPLTWFFPFYPLLILVPVIKNWSNSPFGLIVHHLSYGAGVIVGAAKIWPKPASLFETSVPTA